MNILKNAALVAAGGAVVAMLSTTQDSYAQEAIVSYVNNGTLGGQAFDDDDAVRYDLVADTGSIEFDLDSDDIDAFHILDNGNYLVSTLFSGTFGGTAIGDGRVIEIAPGATSFSVFFDAESLYSSSADISAFTVDTLGNYYFSDNGNGPFTIGATSFSDGDLVLFTPGTGIATIAIEETDLFDDGDGDIDAAHVLPDGRFVLSATDDELISGTTFEDGDLFIYDALLGTASLFLDESLVADSVGSADLNAAFVVSIPEPATLGLLSVAGLGLIRRRRGGVA